MGVTRTMVETRTIHRQGTEDSAKDCVMRPFALVNVATLRTGTLLAQIRLHLPLYYHLWRPGE